MLRQIREAAEAMEKDGTPKSRMEITVTRQQWLWLMEEIGVNANPTKSMPGGTMDGISIRVV
jgi:hypothetical protein